MTGAMFILEEALLDQLRAIREPMDRIDKSIRDDNDEIHAALRDLRRELADLRRRIGRIEGKS